MKADCQVLHPFQFLDCFHSVQFDQTTAVSLLIAVFMSIAYPGIGRGRLFRSTVSPYALGRCNDPHRRYRNLSMLRN